MQKIATISTVCINKQEGKITLGTYLPIVIVQEVTGILKE
jgi:hypothetical protein